MAESVEFGDGRLPEQFWSRVTITDTGCWLWTGSIGRNGYGRCSRKFGHTYAHRAIYISLIAAIPIALDVDHLCHVPSECRERNRCPHRRCVNPAHLEATTPRVNVLRSGGVAAHNATKTECPKGHPLSGDNLMLDGRRRTCRICKYNSKHQWYATHREETLAMYQRAHEKVRADPERYAKHLQWQKDYDARRRPRQTKAMAQGR